MDAKDQGRSMVSFFGCDEAKGRAYEKRVLTLIVQCRADMDISPFRSTNVLDSSFYGVICTHLNGI